MPQVFKNQPFIKRQFFQLEYPFPSRQGVNKFSSVLQLLALRLFCKRFCISRPQNSTSPLGPFYYPAFYCSFSSPPGPLSTVWSGGDKLIIN